MRRMLLLLIPLVLLGVVGWGFYLLRTVDVDVPRGAIDVVMPQRVVDNGLLTRTYYLAYAVLPSESTEAEAVYRVAVDNGAVARETKVLWDAVELDIGKAKTVRHKISEDEYVALGMKPRYDIQVSQVRSERDGTYLLWPVLYMGVVVLAAMAGIELLGRPKKRQRINYKRPFRKQSVETESVQLTDEELAQRCFQCASLKSVNGVLRCSRDVCKYTN